MSCRIKVLTYILILLVVVMCVIYYNNMDTMTIEQSNNEGFASIGSILNKARQKARNEARLLEKKRIADQKAIDAAAKQQKLEARRASAFASANALATKVINESKSAAAAADAADAAELVRLEKEEADQIAADIEQANVDKEAEEANTTAANNLKTAATNIANNNRNIYYNRTDAEKTNQLAQFETYLETQQYDSFKYQLAKILYDLPDIGPSYAEKVQVIGNLINLYSESEDKFKEGIRNIYIVNDFLLTDLAMVRL